MKKIKEFLVNLWDVLRLPEMLILPGNLAFFLILSLVPIITLFGFVSSSFSLSTSSIISFIGNIIPSGVMEMLIPFLSGDGISTSSIVFMVIGFYAASNGPDSLITASNFLYETENKNYLYRRIKALFMTVWLLILFVVVLILMAFGSFILTKLLAFSIIGDFIIKYYQIITSIKLLIAFLIIFITIKILYTMSPDVRIRSKYVNRGAMFATISIMILTSLYSFYVTNIAHYNVIYGGLANIIVLMFLIYMISYIIVLGIAINHNYYKLENE